MTTATQDIKITCHNHILKGSEAKSVEGHPWRSWKISLVAMDGDKEVKGKLSMILNYVQYILHPTFSDPHRTRKTEPYLLQEKGWGEFDLKIVLYFKDDIASPQVLSFDLNFALPSYSKVITIEFPNASNDLVELLSSDPSKSLSSADSSTNAARPRKGGKKVHSPGASNTVNISPPSPSYNPHSSEKEDGQYREPSPSNVRKRETSNPDPEEAGGYNWSPKSPGYYPTDDSPTYFNYDHNYASTNNSSSSNRSGNNSSDSAKAPSSRKRKNSYTVIETEEERTPVRSRCSTDNIVLAPSPAMPDVDGSILEEEYSVSPSVWGRRGTTPSDFEYPGSNSNSPQYPNYFKALRQSTTSVSPTNSMDSGYSYGVQSPLWRVSSPEVGELEEGEDRDDVSDDEEEEEGLVEEDEVPELDFEECLEEGVDDEQTVNKQWRDKNGHESLKDNDKEDKKPEVVGPRVPGVIYTLKDLYQLDRNCYAALTAKTDQSATSTEIDIWELARRLILLTPEQNQDFQKLIVEYADENIDFQLGPDETSAHLDLYTCNDTLLKKLWEFVEDLYSADEDSEDPLTDDEDDHLSDDYILDENYDPIY